MNEKKNNLALFFLFGPLNLLIFQSTIECLEVKNMEAQTLFEKSIQQEAKQETDMLLEDADTEVLFSEFATTVTCTIKVVTDGQEFHCGSIAADYNTAAEKSLIFLRGLLELRAAQEQRILSQQH